MSDSMGVTELMKAATEEDVTPLLKMLASGNHNADLFIKDHKGRTALDWARMCRNYQAVTLLVRAMSADINIARVSAAAAPLDIEHYLRETNTYQTKALFKALKLRDVEKAVQIIEENKLYRTEVEGIGKKFFLDSVAHSGYTPLILAAGFNMLPVVNMLIENDVELETQNKFGHTAFTYACSTGNSDIARVLLFRGANVHHATHEGRTGLHYACMYAKARTVKTILDYMLETFATFRIEEHTFRDFDYTRWTRYSAILESLINARDNQGKQAIDLIPDKIKSKFKMETRLKLSGVKALDRLNRHPGDESSQIVNRDFCDYDGASKDSRVSDMNDTHGSLGSQNPGDDYNYDDGDDLGAGAGMGISRRNRRTYGDTDGKNRQQTNGAAAPASGLMGSQSSYTDSNVNSGGGEGTDLGKRSVGDNEALVATGAASPAIGPQNRGSAEKADDADAAVDDDHDDVDADNGGAVRGDVAIKGEEYGGDARDDISLLDYIRGLNIALESAEEHDSHGGQQKGAGLTRRIQEGDNEKNDDDDDDDDDHGDDGDDEDPLYALALNAEDDMSYTSEISGYSYVSLQDWSHDTDQRHVTDMSQITHQHSVKTALPLREEQDMIRSLFRKVRDRISQWIAAASKEKELVTMVHCPLHCGVMCKVETLTAHVRDDCPYRSLQCKRCHHLVRFIELKDHNLKLCQKRIVACPNTYKGCTAMVPFDSVDPHLVLKCPLRLMHCRQYCGAMIPYCKRENHEQQHCKNRTIQCDRCKESIVANTYTEHLHNRCPERILKCTVGCGQSFKARDLPHHEAEVCTRPCKWHCGERIGPPEQLVLHEVAACPERPQECPLLCGTCHLTGKNVRAHEQQFCVNRWVRCPQGCGELLQAKDVATHTDSLRGLCPERLVRCPSNLIGWRIMVHPNNDTGIVLKYERQSLLEGNHQKSDFSGIDQLYVRFDHRHEWIDYWTCSYTLLEKVQGEGETLRKSLHIDEKFSCGWISCAELNDHLNLTCEHRALYLQGEADKKMGHGGQKTTFKDAAKTAEIRSSIDTFEAVNTTESAGAYCGFCSVYVADSNFIEEHYKQECQEFIVKCPYGCPDRMAKKKVSEHTASLCPKRPVVCERCGNTDLWAEEMEEHLRDICTERIVPCPLECDSMSVTAAAATAHCDFECPHRKQMCSCGLTFMAKEMDEHQRLNCNDRLIFCPLGCGEMMKNENIERHVEFFCANKNFKYQKETECPNCCGARLMIRDVIEHLSYHCPRRLVECTFRCGNSVQLDKIDEHMNFCPMRKVGCEPDMKPCMMFLHEWFCREEEQGTKFGEEGTLDLTADPVSAMLLQEEQQSQDWGFSGEGYGEGDGSLTADSSFAMGDGAASPLLLGHATPASPSRAGAVVVFQGSGVATPAQEVVARGMATADGRRTGDAKASSSNRREVDARLIHRLLKEPTEAMLNPFSQGLVPGPNDLDDDDDNQEDGHDDGEGNDEDDAGHTDGEGNVTMAPSKESKQRLKHMQKRQKRMMTLHKSETMDIKLNAGKGKTLMEMIQITRLDTPKDGGASTATSAVREIGKTGAAYIENHHAGSQISSTASTFQDGFKMKFHEELRMHRCKRHGCSVVHAAVRYNDLSLMESILRQVKESEDIDFENIYGDTALTLACRLGRVKFVELIIQNGADINKETFNGKTALIEATKAEKENVQLIELLVESGSIVSYKTARHGQTALHWAKLLKRPKSTRILDLAAVVQLQSNRLFFSISCGKTEMINRLIKDGEFFDANGEAKCYAEMSRYGDLYDDNNTELDRIRNTIEAKSGAVDAAQKAMEESAQTVEEAQQQLDQAFGDESIVNKRISKEFSTFEKVSSRLVMVDIEELLSIRKPLYVLRLAVFAYGVVFHMLDSDDWSPFTPCNAQSSRQWWPVMMQSIKQSSSRQSLKRLQAFTIARLESEAAQPIIERAKQLFEDLVEGLGKERERQKQRRENGSETYPSGNDDSSAKSADIRWRKRMFGRVNSTGDMSFDLDSPSGRSAGASAGGGAGGSFRGAFFGGKSRGGEGGGGSFSIRWDEDSGGASGRPGTGLLSEAGDNASAATGASADGGIADEDWDSDAEDAGDGYWHKGEWVGVSKKKDKWWEKSGARADRSEASSIGRISENGGGEMLKEKQKSKLIILTDDVIEEELRKRNVTSAGSIGMGIEGDGGNGRGAGNGYSRGGARGQGVVLEDPHAVSPDGSSVGGGSVGSSRRGGGRGGSRMGRPPGTPQSSRRAGTRQGSRQSSSRGAQSNRGRKRADSSSHSAGAGAATAAAGGGGGVRKGEGKGEGEWQSKSAKQKMYSVVDGAVTAARSASQDFMELPGGGGGGDADSEAGQWDDEGEGDDWDDGYSTAQSVDSASRSDRSPSRTGKRSGCKTSKSSSAGGKLPVSLSRSNLLREDHYPEEDEEGAGGDMLKLGGRRKSRKGKHSRRGKAGKRPLDPIDMEHADLLADIHEDDVEGFRFIEAILSMLKAIVRFSRDRMQLRELKKITAQRSIYLEDLRLAHQKLVDKYQKEFAFRADIENKLIEHLKKERFLKGRLMGFREKVRVARLLNTVSVNGHTPISWAAANGNYEVVEEMLTHGGTVGYPPQLLHLTATYLQLSYKIYLRYCEAKKPLPLKDDGSGERQRRDPIQFVRDITMMKDKRRKLHDILIFKRSRMRFPVPEATYTGKWEIVKRIYDRRLFHVFFSNTWIFPSAPPPFRRRLDMVYEHSKMSIADVLTHGMNDLAAGAFVPTMGWVGPNDHREPYGETQHHIAEILLDLQEKREKFWAARYRIRLLANEKRNQAQGEIEMRQAIKDRDFKRCIYLARRRGITIDLETKEGYTALLAAAEERVDAVNHEFIRNDDGRECLAVEYLLDRTVYRPSINLEATMSGHTPLIRACVLSRGEVVEALLDRNADINYVNKFGRTALHYAALAGDAVCTRILIERFADKTIEDKDGLTAYQIADRENFTSVMTLLSQFQGGFLGPIQVSRGRVNNSVNCPLGCGIPMFKYEIKEHLLVCEWRKVACPNDCEDTTLLSKEMPDHLERKCSRRLIECDQCEEDVEARMMEDHKANHCNCRMIDCELGCGYACRFCDLERHQLHCLWRLIDCPLQCGMQVQVRESSYHVKEECENRRVPCPLKCRGLVVAKLLPVHMDTMCPNRIVLCKFCTLKVRKGGEEAHEKECASRLVPCREKCGAQVNLDKMQEHLQNHCAHRYVDCPLECGIKVRVANLTAHEQQQCQNRLVDCPNGCVESELVALSDRKVLKVPARVLQLHLKYDCPERRNRCSLCMQDVRACEREEHEREGCPRREVQCRVEGCFKTLAIEEREHHERYTCRFRQIMCKQGCGEQVTAIRAGVHMQRTCPMRFVQCTLNCGTQCRAKDLEEHLKLECTRRHGVEAEAAARDREKAAERARRKAKVAAKTPQAKAAAGASEAEIIEIQRKNIEGGLSSGIAQGLFMLGTKQEDKGWVSGGKRARERLNKAISSAGSKSTGQLLPQVNQTTQPVLKSSSPSVDGTCSLATGSTAATQSGVSADMSRDDTTAAAGAK